LASIPSDMGMCGAHGSGANHLVRMIKEALVRRYGDEDGCGQERMEEKVMPNRVVLAGSRRSGSQETVRGKQAYASQIAPHGQP
jgi:hypothetical protein